MLVKDEKIYNQLKYTVLHVAFEIHAIYEPDGSEIYGDCYSAAVDLFKPGLTFKIYFKIREDHSLDVISAERWHFG